MRLPALVCTFFLAGIFYCTTHAQIISTVAGTGIFGYSGDGGPATSAMLMFGIHTATDASGNVYFTDGFGCRIRKIDAAGVITTIAGTGLTGYSGDGGPATAAAIYGASGIVIDNAGNIYFGTHDAIRKINTAGIIETIAGSATAGFAGDGGPASAALLNMPYGLALDAAGNLYIADLNNGRIRKINLATDGLIHTVAGSGIPTYAGDGGPATAAGLTPRDVAIDHGGNLLIAEEGGNRIRKVNAAGIITTLAGDGIASFSGDGGPSTAAGINAPTGLTVGFDGTVYCAEHGNSRIRTIGPGPGDTIRTIAGTGVFGYGGDGGLATAADLYAPNGVTTDAQGNIFICDWRNYRIRRISTLNRAPWFTQGTIADLTACSEYNNTDTLLQVMDTNAYQSITWSIASPPAHGSAAVSYSANSTGGIIMPTGTGYTPAAGYSGPDTFRVRVFDGAVADTITIAVDVLPTPAAAPITGPDTICVGDSAFFSGAMAAGLWSSSTSNATISAAGQATAMTPGTTVISYIVSNDCGTAYATHMLTILPAEACPTGISTIENQTETHLYPNPNDGHLKLLLAKGLQAHITITDLAGKVIKEMQANQSTEIGLNVPVGVYMATIVSSYGIVHERVIVN